MSHSKPKPSNTTTTTRTNPVELPPPAWGSPAHLAQRKAEKEWKIHLRAHASVDAAKRASGKHTRYVDAVDVLIRYELPPVWELLEGGVAKQGENLWVLPEDDDELVKVLKATSAPFFQRTGEFAKPSTAFKTPPLAKSPAREPSPDARKVHVDTPEIVLKSSELAKPTTVAVSSSTNNTSSSNNVARESDSTTIQPRKAYLPVAISNLFYRMGQMFLWFIPGPLRARLNIWWSPVLGRPVRRDDHV